MIRIIAGKYRGRKLEVPDVVVTASGSDGNGRANARNSEQSERKPLAAARGAKPQNANYKVRPTSSRTREAVFNILSHFSERGGENIIQGASVLDVCCGSGAMAFEALSRGAEAATLIDNDRRVISNAKKNAEKLGAGEVTKLLCADAFSLPKAYSSYDLAFIDPPYGKANLEKCLDQLSENGWLAKGGIIVLEFERQQEVTLPENFRIIMDRTYGIARVLVLEVI